MNSLTQVRKYSGKSILGIPKKHVGIVLEIKRVFDSGITRSHTSFEGDYRLRIPSLDYGHSGNRTV